MTQKKSALRKKRAIVSLKQKKYRSPRNVNSLIEPSMILLSHWNISLSLSMRMECKFLRSAKSQKSMKVLMLLFWSRWSIMSSRMSQFSQNSSIWKRKIFTFLSHNVWDSHEWVFSWQIELLILRKLYFLFIDYFRKEI